MYGKINIKRGIKVRVHLNTTTNNYQNPNFNAKFSKSAQAYIDNELCQMKEYSKFGRNKEYYRECSKFAKDLIKQIKGINPGKYSLIKLNGDAFECNVYNTAEDMKAENGNWQSSTIVSDDVVNKHFIIDVLLNLKAGMYNCAQMRDNYRYDSISRLWINHPKCRGGSCSL